MLTVSDALAAMARRYAAKPALIFGDRRLTFAEFDERVNRAARALLAAGLQPGQRVAFLLPNGLEMAEAYFAVARAGLVGVPINLRWAPAEIAFALADSGAAFVLADPAFRGALPAGLPVAFTGGSQGAGDWEARVAAAAADPPPVTVRDRDPWVIVYTSGTTGRPKGAVRSHRSNVMIALQLLAELGITADDTGLALLPMFHVNSMWLVSLAVAVGATCAIYPHRTFHPQSVVAEFNRLGVTFSMFVPSLLTFLADAAETGQLDTGSLRVMLTSSAPLDSTLRDRLLAAFPGVHLYDIYGATEYGAVSVLPHRPGGTLGSVGYPLLGVDVRIRGEDGRLQPEGSIGEIFVRSPALMDGYWGQEAATAQATDPDGFLSVGDMGYLGRDGQLYLVDRKSDMIIMAGENVYPREVEEVLLHAPDVALAAVFGVPDPRRGERVVALVTPKPGQTVDMARLRELTRTLLADYKRPAVIEVVPELPVGASGKVVRRLARQQWLEAHPGGSAV
ncbi:MAG: AMP-binding protein [Firmicutes bacterium]|nr:AMP-binding protein [Bacillota bacterium]